MHPICNNFHIAKCCNSSLSMRSEFLYFSLIISFLLFSCQSRKGDNSQQHRLIIFHAGSLTVPFQHLAKAFEEEHPGLELWLEGAGSVECARKISELKKDCDIFASADYSIIEELLFPEYADWYINFAGNEMVIAFNNESKFADIINEANSFDILLKDEVVFGRSDPNLDPCGYRTIFSFQLAEIYYNKDKLSERLMAKNNNMIRPKEVDLLALLETHVLDYIFIYRSVAEQHNLNYIVLPDEVNQSNPAYSVFYSQASTKISGKHPGTYLLKTAIPMTYAVSILKNAANKEMAIKFVVFMMSEEGRRIIEDNAQPWMNFVKKEFEYKIPEEILPLIKFY